MQENGSKITNQPFYVPGEVETHNGGRPLQQFFTRRIDKTKDAISGIEKWEQNDPDRFKTVDDYKDPDNDSNNEERKIRRETKETINLFKEIKDKKNKLEVLRVLSINWNTTLEKVKLEVLLNMYATRDYDPDTIKFDKEIADMDAERALLNNQKTTALFDGDSAPVCKGGDEKDARASHPEERCDNTLEDTIYLPKSKKLELYVMSQAKKGMEAITWSEISEAIEDNPKLKKIRNTLRYGTRAKQRTHSQR